MAEPVLNQWEKNFVNLRKVITRTLGVEILVTITGYCVDAPAILSEVRKDDIFVDGPMAENGGWTIIMLLRDLSAIPPQNTPISVNGDAAGLTLRTVGEVTKTNNATATFTAGDYTARNK